MARINKNKVPPGEERALHVFIMFADIKGFSALKKGQQRLYLKEVVERIANILGDPDHNVVQANTWGDGLFAYFNTASGAIRCALVLRDFFRRHDWDKRNLPQLKIRISLNSGEVFEGYNPITGKTELIGTEVNRAARIEPVVEPNHVYATKAFVQICNEYESPFAKFESLGDIELPKGWGQEELYVAGWLSDEVSAKSVISSPAYDGSAVSKVAGHFSKTSIFGHRLEISQQAKSHIGRYCAKNGFWRHDEVVFLESGTLPIYLLHELYSVDPKYRPRRIVTNNVAASMMTIMGDSTASEDEFIFPEDKPSKCTLIGGVLFLDYAATIPEDLLDAGHASGELRRRLEACGVTHVIMMVSKFDIKKGPCAVGEENRRFKRELVLFVKETPGARLSVLLEAEKLVARRGWPCEDVDGDSAPWNWPELVASGRIQIITCESPELTRVERELLRREVRALRDQGAQVVLLDSLGELVHDEVP